MAIYNEILVGRYARMLQKLFGIKGTVPTKQLAGEIAPAFPLFNGVENRYLETWDRFAVGAFVGAGGVGTHAAARLRNAANSNVVGIIEKLAFWNLLADTPFISLAPGLADLPIPSAGSIRLDPRGRSNPSLIFSSGTAAAPATTTMQISQPAGVTVDLILFEDHEIPILPGDSVTFFANILNQSLNFAIIWRERFLEESERT